MPLFKEDSEFIKGGLEKNVDWRKKTQEREEEERKQILEEQSLADERAFELKKINCAVKMMIVN